MLPRQIYAIVAAFLLQPGTFVTASADESFLADTLVRKDQVQNVLEHQPVKKPVCQQIVRLNTCYAMLLSGVFGY